MVEREHFTNGRCYTGGGGLALVLAAFTTQITGWHHWISIGVAYGMGGVLILLSTVWITRSYYTRDRSGPVPAPSLAPPLDGQTIAFGGRGTLEEVQVEHARVLALGNQLDGVFNPLQVEAVRLASDLETFMNRIGDRPSAPPGSDWDGIFDHAVRGEGGKWVVRMQAEYEQDYSPRVNSFVGRLERETGRLNSRLRAHKDHVHDFGNINTIRAQLWKEALFPLTIDFAGE